MKTCSKCKQDKERNEFPKTITNKDGLSYLCTDCNRKQNKEYRTRNGGTYYSNQQAWRSTPEGFVSNVVHGAKTRATKKKMAFDITTKDIFDMMSAQDMKCAVTGVKMTLESLNRKKANAFKCSIDRIDSNGGYTKDNIRLVCWAVNQMKADRTDEEFKFWVNSLHKAISSQA